jgi:hypothetical protein
MNFVYICREGSNEELRYSIRSVLYFYPDADIHIFGGKPGWYSGKYTYVKDYGSKFDNINECYKSICSSNIDKFILMNDDFFIINKIESFDYYYDGTLEDKIESHMNRYGISKYSRVLAEANKKLKKMGIDNPLNYDIHVPMIFEKDKLAKVIDLSEAPRSMYGNIYGVGGKKIIDNKIYKYTKEIDTNGYFLSSEDNTFKKIFSFLESKFKNPSSYELDLFTTSSI